MRVWRSVARIVMIALAMQVSLHAQTTAAGSAPTRPAGRLFVSVNGMFQATANDFNNQFTFPENGEEALVDTDYTVEGGMAFDVAGGYLFSRRFGVGAGFTKFSRHTPAAVSGTIPHPFFFNQPRSIAGEVEGLTREEHAVHVQARIVIPAGPRLQIMVFGGPSFFSVQQGLVEDIEYSETYPYDEVAFERAVTSTVEASAVGVHLGADIAYFFTRQIGVGGGAQYVRATVELPSAGGGTFEVKAGGLQVGGGLRLRF